MLIFALQYGPEQFERDGRTLVGAHSYIQLANMIHESEALVRVQGQSEEIRIAQAFNGQTLLAGRVDVVENELSCLRRETSIEIAKGEEERDGRVNERWGF